MAQPGQSDSPRTTKITVLWATHEHYPTPHVVRAWSQSLIECYGDEDLVAEAKDWMEHWGDDTGWTYWTTSETVPVPAGAPVCAEELR
jgi:hypothetical protein